MDFLLIAVLAALLVFMFWNSRKRMQKMKAEQEEKRRLTLPGARVLLQGGLFGTIVAYDSEDLDKPAEVELAPGVIVEVHSQAIVRVVTEDAEGDVHTEADFSEANYAEGEAPDIERIDPSDVDSKPSDKRADS